MNKTLDQGRAEVVYSMTINNANSIIGKTIYAGDAKIYTNPDNFIFDSGDKQYYEDDPYYMVLREDKKYYAVRHHSLKDGVTGWFKKEDVLVVDLVEAVKYPRPISAFEDAANEFRQIKKDLMAIAEKLSDIAKRLG